jgi:hypothetical protein
LAKPHAGHMLSGLRASLRDVDDETAAVNSELQAAQDVSTSAPPLGGLQHLLNPAQQVRLAVEKEWHGSRVHYAFIVLTVLLVWKSAVLLYAIMSSRTISWVVIILLGFAVPAFCFISTYFKCCCGATALPVDLKRVRTHLASIFPTSHSQTQP